MSTKILTLSSILLLLAISACAPRRDLVYFSNMAANTTSASEAQNPEVRIRQNDVVSVTMNSLSPESNILFASNKNTAADAASKGYRVNKNGTIPLPIIGEFKIEGMTNEEAQTGIKAALNKYVKNPEVEVQIVNFKITVIGEVNKPSTFIINDEKVNLLEALGLAGDMTVYGKRENVLIIRTEDGHKTMRRLNLNQQETLNSPFFNLRQNDIVYVEPDRSKAIEYSSNTRIVPMIIASISAAAVLVAVLLKR